MSRHRLVCFCVVLVAVSLHVGTAHAQVGYGVTANGTLFRFDVSSPGAVTTIGNMGIVTEAIDFRPGTSTLYGIDVGPITTQLYTINTATAAVTPVGAGFPSVGGGYSLVNTPIGFDFNPATLQGDGSVRIRVTTGNGGNVRLNSDTGLVVAADTSLAYAAGDPNFGNSPFVDAVAYTNTGVASAAGVTTLYGLDTRHADLARIGGVNGPPSPNTGSLVTVGSFGATITSNPNSGFDILSTGTDDGLADEQAFAVLTRPDAPPGNFNAWLLYDVNLATGQITNGALVGGGIDFTGGFAVTVPEPAVLALAAPLALVARRRQRR